MSSNRMSIPTKNGKIARLRLSSDTLEVLLATNKLTPKGGVQKPIARLTVRMTPNNIGSTPSAVATGNRIGVMIMIEEIVSMNIPITRRSKLISNKMTIGLSDRLVMLIAKSLGIRASVINLPKAVAITTSTKIVPLVFALLAKISGRSLKVISPYTKMPIRVA